MDKILTVVIPTYNMEKYLDKCLTSLIVDDADLMKRLEVLVVIDGATDRSSEIAHTYQGRFSDTFRVIDKENGNYGSCVNRGLKEAEGKYIKILDADDSFDTANFKEFLKFLLTVDVDCVISDTIKVYEDGTIEKIYKYNLPVKGLSFSLDDLESEAENIIMHSVCYLTSNLRDMDYHQTEGISYTDTEWACFPMSVSKKLVYFPHSVYRYLIGREGQTVNPIVWEKNFSQLVKVAENMMQKFRMSCAVCTAGGEKYMNIRIRYVIGLIYSMFFRLFLSWDNNCCMSEFDKFLKNYDPEFYNAIGESSHCCKLYYVLHWRKNYRPDTFYLNMMRRLSRLESNLKRNQI